MNQEDLQNLLSDENTVNTVLSLLQNKTQDAVPTPRDESGFICSLMRYLPKREQALAKKVICALLLLSVLEQTKQSE